jgi:outer membrane protein TolC
MKRHVRQVTAVITLLSMIATGCAPARPFYFFEDGDRSHYKGVATEIEYPDVETLVLDDVTQAQAPLTVAHNEPHEFWDLTLEEAMRNALANAKVMRQLGAQLSSNLQLQGNGFQGVASQLTQAPQSATTVYQPAIADSDPNFGTEAALSAFDAQLDNVATTGIVDDPLNLNPNLQIFQRQVQQATTFTNATNIRKTTAAGTQLLIGHGQSFLWNNSPSNAFPSVWRNQIDLRFAQPLLQGAGVDFNRIAGPAPFRNSNFDVSQRDPGNYRGIVIARINTDIALADFETGVRNLVSDTENCYWTLYYAYRNLDANVAGRDSSLQTWRKVHAMAQAGAADAAQEAQAREQYFLFRAQVEDSLSAMYSAENRLRYMMGLAATDGRLIRPSDEPTTAKIVFDWQQAHQEALGRAVELRRQRWTVKRREMELIASKNYMLPQLDLIGGYRFKGFGDDLWSANGNKPRFAYAYQTLLGGDFQEWDLGATFVMPLGFRQGLAAVRNAQLQLARERAVLQDQELEVSHQLAEAIRSLDRAYMLSQTHFNRRVAALRQVEAVRQSYEVGRITLDQLLDAQRRLADAEARYFESLAQYNRAITAVHYRKGSLLEYNAVYLAEGPWATKAYFDAEQRSRQRDAGIFFNYGFTRPQVISQGPVEQNVGSTEYMGDGGEVPVEGEMLPGSVIREEGSAAPAMPTPAIPTPSIDGRPGATPGTPSLAPPAPVLPAPAPAIPPSGSARNGSAGPSEIETVAYSRQVGTSQSRRSAPAHQPTAAGQLTRR